MGDQGLVRVIGDLEDHVGVFDGTEPGVVGALAAAGVDHELVSYPGVEHAFFWPGTPPFSPRARDDAWRRVIELLAS